MVSIGRGAYPVSHDHVGICRRKQWNVAEGCVSLQVLSNIWYCGPRSFYMLSCALCDLTRFDPPLADICGVIAHSRSFAIQ